MQNYQEIPSSQMHTIVTKLPTIELSYETNSHKKDDISYIIGLAIAVGKKYYAWITYNDEGENIIYMMEINREHKIARIFWRPFDLHRKNRKPIYEIGTIFYGTVTEDGIFLIEDILYHEGVKTKFFLFPHRMNFIFRFLQNIRGLPFLLPIIWDNSKKEMGQIPDKWSDCIGYQVHHIQYRCPYKIAPYVNIFFHKPSINIEGNLITGSKINIREPIYYKCNYKHDYSKPQYKLSTIFLVKADINTDIYRLFAYGRNKTKEYYGIAYIASYESSVFMNSLFRHIKENKNLDYIEESDDEEEFENVDPERFVNLEKELLIECVFLTKFKKWIPKNVISGGKIVHIGQLCRDF